MTFNNSTNELICYEYKGKKTETEIKSYENNNLSILNCNSNGGVFFLLIKQTNIYTCIFEINSN